MAKRCGKDTDVAIKLALAGDTMLGRGVADRLAASSPEALFSPEIVEIATNQFDHYPARARLGLGRRQAYAEGRGASLPLRVAPRWGNVRAPVRERLPPLLGAGPAPQLISPPPGHLRRSAAPTQNQRV